MMRDWVLLAFLIGLAACLADGKESFASDLQTEYVTTTPLLEDGVLYIASSLEPEQRSRLRAINLLESFPITLWDAAERMPLAGIGAAPGALASSDPPAVMQKDNQYRSLFTNLGQVQLPLTAGQAAALESALGAASLADAELLLHAVRGRRGGSVAQPAGTSEDDQRLWRISSAPLLVGRSQVNAAARQRDRVLYAGASDGMLHAFFVSQWDTDLDIYPLDDPAGGTELWGYLPGSFLPSLRSQPLGSSLGEVAVSLDGSAAVKELFVDLDGDGHRHWHTLLVASGTLPQLRRSCLFVLDITDPYQPALLWEKLLPGVGVGRTRGLVVAACGSSAEGENCIYLTADVNGEVEPSGINALAVELLTGQQLWQFNIAYLAPGPAADATPAVPALMDFDGDGQSETLLFGDLVGQLWALNLVDGRAYGDAPAYIVPGGAMEPIGSGVAVLGNLAAFGTGGVAEADNNYQYSIYAVEISPEGGHLRWVYPLAAGEKLWETPVFDAAGNLLFATARDYISLARIADQPTSGRLVVLNPAGEEGLTRPTASATLGKIVKAPGVTISVSLTGEVTQFGTASRLIGPNGAPGSVQILSWRQR